MARIFFGLMLIFSLAACSSLSEKEEARGWSAQKLESEAKLALQGGDYEKAVRYYELLEARYPLGRIAQQAQLNMIYAYYKNDEPEAAVLAADRFIKLYPRHPYIDYVYYMKGLVYFNENIGPLERFFPIDMSQRDQAASTKSFKAFAELAERYPDSPYTQDAIQRMQFLRNSLAAYEMHAADYYMRRGAYLAAANRAQYVVEHYDGSPSIEIALQTLVEAYIKMDMLGQAADALRVLKLNFAENPQIGKLEQALGSTGES